LRQLIARKRNFPRIVARIRNEPALIDALLEGLTSQTPPVKSGSAKALWLLGEAAPELLYPRFDFFLALLACLASVDAGGKLEAALDKYLSPIPGPETIGAGNAIQWASRIALAKLGARSANYKTAECRNVAIGHASPLPREGCPVREETPRWMKGIKKRARLGERGECARLS
jgi:hypothetical protein